MAAKHDPPAGRLLLELRVDRQFYAATETQDGYQLRFFGTADIIVNRELNHATIHLVRGVDPDLGGVLISGSLLAFVLTLRGDAVLHASAVQIGGKALAFVGGSGMGKSTSATLMCAAGARLITDDLLRLRLGDGPPRCFLGATESRLRKSAGNLAAHFDKMPGRRTTGDAREALELPSARGEALPLATIVVPVPVRDPEVRTVALERLAPKSALLLLSRFPRLLGWRDEVVLRRQFQQLGDIIDAVPVHVAALPWGPPFPASLAEELRKGLGMTAAEPHSGSGSNEPHSGSGSKPQDKESQWFADSTDAR